MRPLLSFIHALHQATDDKDCSGNSSNDCANRGAARLFGVQTIDNRLEINDHEREPHNERMMSKKREEEGRKKLENGEKKETQSEQLSHNHTKVTINL